MNNRRKTQEAHHCATNALQEYLSASTLLETPLRAAAETGETFDVADGFLLVIRIRLYIQVIVVS